MSFSKRGEIFLPSSYLAVSLFFLKSSVMDRMCFCVSWKEGRSKNNNFLLTRKGIHLCHAREKSIVKFATERRTQELIFSSQDWKKRDDGVSKDRLTDWKDLTFDTTRI